MRLEEDYDADEILREDDDSFIDEEQEDEDSIRELNLGNESDSQENLRELESDIDDEDNLWD